MSCCVALASLTIKAGSISVLVFKICISAIVWLRLETKIRFIYRFEQVLHFFISGNYIFTNKTNTTYA